MLEQGVHRYDEEPGERADRNQQRIAIQSSRTKTIPITIAPIATPIGSTLTA